MKMISGCDLLSLKKVKRLRLEPEGVLTGGCDWTDEEGCDLRS
ncbi:hypothetical protein HanRHA438_Chr17g0824131 [Helianthus annuus]|nr:hypothetical protein HanRHA438_Chr17g0824131 [Helianthus annuus]